VLDKNEKLRSQLREELNICVANFKLIMEKAEKLMQAELMIIYKK
jgi:hypothetical protein